MTHLYAHLDRSRMFVCAVILAGLCALGSTAAAQQTSPSYPNRSIRMLVGFPPGQASDIQARELARLLTRSLGQNVYVENKPGAAGIIAMETAKSATPDGYTLIFTSSGPIAMNPSMYAKLPYDTLTDFIPILITNSGPVFMIANKDFPPNSIRELLAYVKANPGKVRYGSGGVGVSGHISMEMFKLASGATDILHVPYNGSPAALTAVISGQVQIMNDPGASVLPQVRAGNAKVLGVAARKRSPLEPNVPTFAEQGLPDDFEVAPWGIVLAPKGTPAPVVARLQSEVQKAVSSTEYMELLSRQASLRGDIAPAETADFIRAEMTKWRTAIKAAGIEPN
jgi:tripartite-type tricarboxylate transporter receptor subunit TctC